MEQLLVTHGRRYRNSLTATRHTDFLFKKNFHTKYFCKKLTVENILCTKINKITVRVYGFLNQSMGHIQEIHILGHILHG